jgi:hypothetical protein
LQMCRARRTDTLRKIEKEKHFIKYDGELYVGDDVEKLRT